MPGDELSRLIRSIDPLLRSWVERNPELREALPAMAEYLKSIAATPSTGRTDQADASGGSRAGGETGSVPKATAPAPTPVIAPRTTSHASVPLVFGDRPVFVNVEGSTSDIGRARAAAHEALTPAANAPQEAVYVADPALIEERARLKAASCRVYAVRHRALGDQDVWNRTKLEMDQLLSKGKSLQRCFLWVFWREREQPSIEVCELCAECYENLAMIAPVAATVVARDELKRFRAQALQLMATAQSALRVALRDTWLTSPDADQDDAHAWLRLTAQRIQQLIPRHMRLDDGADPHTWAELRSEIAALKAETEALVAGASRSSQKLNKLKYDVKRIEREGKAAPSEYWSALTAALTDLSPDDPRVREVMRSLVEFTVPEEFEPAIGPYVAASKASLREDDEDDDEYTVREYSSAVKRVRAALAGARVVLTGGEPYPHQQRKLEEAFELREVDWVSLREHASTDPLLSAIRRPGTRIVLVLVKLAGHAHVEDAQDQCRLLGIPCVLLKAGINPERVAADILSQVSVQLGIAESPAK